MDFEGNALLPQMKHPNVLLPFKVLKYMELQMMVAIGKSNIKASCKLHLPFSHNAIFFHESFFT
jgi:hypothetical protein